MNRYREDRKYIFRPPKYSHVLAPFIYLLSDIFYLRLRDKIIDVNVVSGGEDVVEKYKSNASFLITPNHCDHSDPHVLMHLSRIYKIPIHFMAAKEIFDINKGLNGKILQRAGIFSIDREGTDLKAIKQAMKIVFNAKYPLVMFPEGEIYHLNEKLTDMNQGAAMIMLRTAKKMKKEKRTNGVFIFPTALKYTYIDDITPTFPQVLKRLEEKLLWKPQESLDLVERIYKFGEALLGIKEKEYLDRTLEGSLDVRLSTFREILISRMEIYYFQALQSGKHAERIRKLRGKIRSFLLYDKKPEKEMLEKYYNDLDILHFAFQLYSYPGQYLKEKASQERIAETLLKFEEDLFHEYKIKGRRSAEVYFCPAINLYEYLDLYKKDPKKAANEVTLKIESSIKSILE